MAGYHNHNWAWNLVGVRGSHYVVLLALVNESGGKGLIERLRMSTLARRCNITEERTRALTRDLRNWDLIHSERREHPENGRQIANAYRLNRERMFPKLTGPDAGNVVGLAIWEGILKELIELRGDHETRILRSQIREAYFDKSERDTKTAQRRGVLYLIAETDIVDEDFREFRKWFNKLRDVVKPYLVDSFQLVHRVKVPEE